MLRASGVDNVEIFEMVDSISNDGLKRILTGLGLPYSYTRPILKDSVISASQSSKTRTLLSYLSLEDLKDLCRCYDFQVGGPKDELIGRLSSHKVKVATYEGLVADVKRWKPSHRYRKEQGYTDDLKAWLNGRGYRISPRCGPTLPDILVDGKYPIEMKRDFNSKSQWNRAAGQIIEYTNAFGSAILVICDYYADQSELEETLQQILTPELRAKCQTVLKE